MQKWICIRDDVAKCFPTMREDSETCLLCGEIVKSKQKKRHVGEKHVELSLKCPIFDCNYTVRGFYNDVLCSIGLHKVGSDR